MKEWELSKNGEDELSVVTRIAWHPLSVVKRGQYMIHYTDCGETGLFVNLFFPVLRKLGIRFCVRDGNAVDSSTYYRLRDILLICTRVFLPDNVKVVRVEVPEYVTVATGGMLDHTGPLMKSSEIVFDPERNIFITPDMAYFANLPAWACIVKKMCELKGIDAGEVDNIVRRFDWVDVLDHVHGYVSALRELTMDYPVYVAGISLDLDFTCLPIPVRKLRLVEDKLELVVGPVETRGVTVIYNNETYFLKDVTLLVKELKLEFSYSNKGKFILDNVYGSIRLRLPDGKEVPHVNDNDPDYGEVCLGTALVDKVQLSGVCTRDLKNILDTVIEALRNVNLDSPFLRGRVGNEVSQLLKELAVQHGKRVGEWCVKNNRESTWNIEDDLDSGSEDDEYEDEEDDFEDDVLVLPVIDILGHFDNDDTW